MKGDGSMGVHELNRDQLVQLKQNYLCEKQKSVSWGELAAADEIVTDEEIYNEYAHIMFTEDDFA